MTISKSSFDTNLSIKTSNLESKPDSYKPTEKVASPTALDLFIPINKKDENIKQCSIIDPYIKKAVEIFSPIIDFLSGDSHTKSMDEFEDLILETEDDTSAIKSHLSEKSKTALDRIYTAVKKIENNKDIDSEELKELIARWKNNKDHRVLLETLKKIKDGKCLKTCDKDLKKVLSEGLETLAKTFEEVLSHPHSEERQHTINKLNHITDNHMDCVEKADKKDLTKENKKEIQDKLSDNKEKIEELTKDKQCSKFIKNSSEKLTDFIASLEYFIHYNLMKEEEEKEIEAKKEEEKKIKIKIEEELAEIKKLCDLHHIMKERSDKKYTQRQKGLERLRQLEALKRLSQNESERLAQDISILKKEYSEIKSAEVFYKNEEDSLKIYIDPINIHDENIYFYRDELEC